jgi:hypothetical protein
MTRFTDAEREMLEWALLWAVEKHCEHDAAVLRAMLEEKEAVGDLVVDVSADVRRMLERDAAIVQRLRALEEELRRQDVDCDFYDAVQPWADEIAAIIEECEK